MVLIKFRNQIPGPFKLSSIDCNDKFIWLDAIISVWNKILKKEEKLTLKKVNK